MSKEHSTVIIVIILASFLGCLKARHKIRTENQEIEVTPIERKVGKIINYMLLVNVSIPILATIVIVFYITFIFFIGQISHGWETSMTPTLVEGDYSFEKTMFFGGTPQRGDIISFVPPFEKNSNVPLTVFKKFIGLHTNIVAFEKRVIGLPGEKIIVKPDENHRSAVYINGKKLNENYITTHPNNYWDKLTYGPYIVPKDSYFMLGDNRDDSNDSRFWGFVKRDRFISKAIVFVYPFHRANL